MEDITNLFKLWAEPYLNPATRIFLGTSKTNYGTFFNKAAPLLDKGWSCVFCLL